MQNQSLRTVTQPEVEPVTLAQAKAHCRIETDVTADDDLVTALIVAARDWAENYCNRYFVQRTVDMTVDAFPYGPITLPGGVVQSVTSITYRDETDTEQTWSSAEYISDLNGEPARIEAGLGFAFPFARSRIGAIKVRYVVGYDATTTSPTDFVANVPQAIKHAILLLVSHWYENRESVFIGREISAEVPQTTESLLWPYRILI